MHYPGGAGNSKPFIGHRKTVLGYKDKPDESFKKNMKPSSADVDRANALYSTPENQKRDLAKCGGDAPTEEEPQTTPEEPVPGGDEDDQEDAEEDAEEEQEDAEEDAEEEEEEAEDEEDD
ncbi:MAG: hypothetical protein Q9180_008437 [Flavoplaca navasiana]